MEENKNESKELKIKYVVPTDLKDYYINGAYGGISIRGEICMHLFSERPPIPKSVIYNISDSNHESILQSEKYEFGGNLVRLIQSSVIMDVATAISIREWLDDKINLILKEREKKNELK